MAKKVKVVNGKTGTPKPTNRGKIAKKKKKKSGGGTTRLTWKVRPIPNWALKKKKEPRKDPPKMGKWMCYTIKSESNSITYVGKTNDMHRRIRQHNGELQGGAKKTSGKGPWTPFIVVKGFHWEHHCLQFEWALQHPWDKKLKKKISVRGIGGRCKSLEHTLAKDKFTSSAPKSTKFTLQVHCTLDRATYCKKAGITEQQFLARRSSQPFVTFYFGRSTSELKETI